MPSVAEGEREQTMEIQGAAQRPPVPVQMEAGIVLLLPVEAAADGERCGAGLHPNPSAVPCARRAGNRRVATEGRNNNNRKRARADEEELRRDVLAEPPEAAAVLGLMALSSG